MNAGTKEKLIKVIVKYLKMLPYLKSDGIVSPCGSFSFLSGCAPCLWHSLSCSMDHLSMMNELCLLVQIVKLHVSLSLYLM